MKLITEEKEKIEKYVAGTANAVDIELVEALFRNESGNEAFKHYLEDDWSRVVKESTPEFSGKDIILDRIHHRIGLKEYQKKQTLIRRISGMYLRVAAILVLPLLLAGGYLLITGRGGKKEKSTMTSIYAPPGARVSFSLPDGSTGMLNSGSSITYAVPFTGDRLVSLYGEAWFEVAHDKNNPFVVDAGKATLKVLGTRFNLNAYPDEEYVEVVLENGSLLFTPEGDEDGVIMEPSERLVYENGKICRSETDPQRYSSWREGKLVFRGDSMYEVARRLERWYNISVVLADSELEQYSFRATFEDDSFEEVLKLLAMTSPIRYSISPRSLLPDGTYSKSVVRITLK
jgi:ferric-dicitrate binding protein FerR (iron transport regulator)